MEEERLDRREEECGEGGRRPGADGHPALPALRGNASASAAHTPTTGPETPLGLSVSKP